MQASRLLPSCIHFAALAGDNRFQMQVRKACLRFALLLTVPLVQAADQALGRVNDTWAQDTKPVCFSCGNALSFDEHHSTCWLTLFFAMTFTAAWPPHQSYLRRQSHSQ
mmetsp:Transcript_29248/g.68088  ORF Transcript_29248/g.68088 Transcript_29248/m.68088 type:complete len:109 (+) Transcript_29248:76-402(+)